MVRDNEHGRIFIRLNRFLCPFACFLLTCFPLILAGAGKGIVIGCMELLAGPGILRTHLGRHGAGPEECPRREAALAPYHHRLPRTPINPRSAPGPCPLAMVG